MQTFLHGYICHICDILQLCKYHLTSLLNEKQRYTFANFLHLFNPTWTKYPSKGKVQKK